MRISRWLVLGLSVVCTSRAMSQTSVVHDALGAAEQPASPALQVPYVAQSELLCGGAAIAMVERWWGRRGVYAAEFAHLVHRESGGIFTSDMSRVMRERGWDVTALSTTADRVRRSLTDSVPVIALIQVRATRYHYVVILGWNASGVTYHDPAVAPSVRVSADAFTRQWNGANRWAMFARPSPAATTATPSVLTPSIAPTIDSLPCRPWLDQAADAATAKRLADADSLLDVAAVNCPSEPVVTRELAGVRFRQGRYGDAARLAAAYARQFRSDTLGWRLLASSRFLSRDEIGALEAWNTIGRPAIDLVRIDGSRRIRFRALATGMGLDAGQRLTPSRLLLARRRLADIPALASANVSYTAVPGGAVEARATVVERPLVEPLPMLLLGVAVRAAVSSQATIVVSTPLGLGELWTAQWRWESADPRVALRVGLPTHIGIPGIVSLERSWDTFRYSAGVADAHRSASSANIHAWLRDDIDGITGARFERWASEGDFLALAVGGAVHEAHDRIALQVEAEHAIPLTGRAAYDRIRTRAAWALPADRWSNSWTLRLGADWTSAPAPRGLWSVAGGDLTRDIPLRAHALIVDNVLASARSGRAIVHGGVASDRHVATLGPVAVGAGVFLDAAQVMLRGDTTTTARYYLDGGAGLRVGLAGLESVALRMDVARGLVTDRRWGVTVGLTQVWPRRLGWAR